MSYSPLSTTLVAEDLFLAHWYAITPDDVRTIAAAAHALNDEDLLHHPLLVTGVLVASQLYGDLSDPSYSAGLERLATIVALARDPRRTTELSAEKQHQWKIMDMIGRRWRRDYAGAHELAETLIADSAGDVKDVLFPGKRDSLWPGHTIVQCGVTEALAGSLDKAMQYFERGYHEGGKPPYRHFAKVNAAANAAMIAAVEGHTDLARAWIDASGSAGEVPNEIRKLTHLGTYIARILLALDAGENAKASEILEPLIARTDNYELWPYLLYTATQVDIAQGSAVRAHERLKQAGFRRGRLTATDTVADHVVFRAYLDSLYMAGEGGIALRLASDLGHPLRSLAPVARIHLHSRDFASAARVSSHALRRARLSRRDMWEATVIHAAAELALGNKDAAMGSFALIVDGKPDVLPRILNSLPSDLVGDLFMAAGVEVPRIARVSPIRSIKLPKLTAREREILQLLAEKYRPKEIAERDQTSEHTVRTHVKNIYRKLGVSSGTDAIVRAEALGLLTWTHLDGKNRALSGD